MAVRLTYLNGTNWVDGEMLLAADLIDTIRRSSLFASPIGSIVAWHKDLLFYSTLSKATAIVHSGSGTNTGTSWMIGRTFTNTGNWNNVSYVRFMQSITTTARTSSAYVSITYSNGSTRNSQEFSTSSTTPILREWANPFVSLTINRIDIFHRISSTPATSIVSDLAIQGGNNNNNFFVENLGSFWVECNGQILNDTASPFNGLVIPNLNNANRFLRGNIGSGTTGGILTNTGSATLHGWGSAIISGSAGHAVYAGSGSHWRPTSTNNCWLSVDYSLNNEPPFMDVCWIMRVK